MSQKLLAIAGTLSIEAAQAGGKLPRFSMVASTGAPMKLAGWTHPVVVALAGLHIPSQSTPIRANHDAAQGVGHTDSISIQNGQLVAQGVVSRDTPAAHDVTSSGRNGFPWQSSIGASVDEVNFVKAGESVTVNGHVVSGPVNVVTKSTLGEISFVDLGADMNTSAMVASRPKGVPMELETEVDPFAAEASRVEAIHAAAQKALSFAGVDAGEIERIRGAAIATDVTAQAAAVDLMRASRPKAPAVFTRHEPATGQTIEASLLLLAGREKLAVEAYGAKAVEQARHSRKRTLLDVVEASLRMNGRDTSGCTRREIAAMGFSTMPLVETFANVMGKTLVQAYVESIAGWQGFAAIKSAVNYLPQVGIRPSSVGPLEEVPKGGEVKHALLGENSFPWQIKRFARMIQVDTMDIVNDNIGFLDEIPMLLGSAGARAVNDEVWSTILANTGSFFNNSTHKNLLTGALGITELAAAISAMRSQRDANNNDIQIIPRVLAGPPELEFLAKGLVESTFLGRTDGEPTGNPLRAALELVSESRLSNTAKFPNASATGWYVFGGPPNAPVIIGFLDGQSTPTVRSEPGELDIFALKFRVEHHYGCALGDFRAAVLSDPS